ncbi:MAG: SpoIIIAH-like family protein [Clostridia bacterium]|nr:SpoIIIAH-like family protein [Clostridia bacterium]
MTIFIRFKNILLFGLMFLSISFMWFVITSLNIREVTLCKDDLTNNSIPSITENQQVSQPLVSIVTQEENAEINKDDFFIEYCLDRDKMRSEQVEILNDLVNNPNSTSQFKIEAQQKLLNITDVMEKESKIENTLIAKGYKRAIAVVQSQSVMIIMPSKEIRQDEIIRISDMVVKIAGCGIEDVIIIPKTE